MADDLPKHRRLAAIMFTDMVGYSALSQRNEALALELLDEHRRLLREIFLRHGTREIEAVGDGFFVECPSALAAAECAVEIQKALHERNAAESLARQFRIRIGLHLGDVVAQGERVHGDGVNIAARIERLAEPGGICVSEDVARQIQNKIDLPLTKLGLADLKNIDLPVEIYRLALPWQIQHGSVANRLAFSLQHRRTRRALFATGILVIVAALAAGLGWQRWTTLGVVNKRLAVLPFVSLSPDQADEYFADGITEELITRLSRLNGLEVIARTSVMSYKGTSKKIAEIGRELDVGTVLEGSVRKEGNKLRVTAQLIRADNEAHLWTDSCDQDLKDALSIQKSIADRVAVAMAARLGTDQSDSQEPHDTQSSEAYNAYLKGRFHANKSTLEGMKQGIVHFEQAVRLDPSFALAYVGLAEAYAQLPIQDDTYAKDAWPKVRSAALTAIQLDPSLAEAHAMLGAVKTFYDYDWPGADTEFKRALVLNPNSSSTHWWYAWYHLFLRHYDEGIAEMRRAVELDPLSIAKNMDLGWAYQFPGRWEESLEQFNKTLAMDPSNVQVLSGIGWAYLFLKRYKEAETAFTDEIVAFGREPWALLDLNYLYAITGDARGAELLDEMENAAKTKPVAGWTRACFYFGNATHDKRYRPEMYRWLERAAEEHSFWLVHTSNQIWVPFHADPGWIGFRKKLGLPP